MNVIKDNVGHLWRVNSNQWQTLKHGGKWEWAEPKGLWLLDVTRDMLPPHIKVTAILDDNYAVVDVSPRQILTEGEAKIRKVQVIYD